MSRPSENRVAYVGTLIQPELRDRLRQVAVARKVSVSTIALEAIAAYLGRSEAVAAQAQTVPRAA